MSPAGDQVRIQSAEHSQLQLLLNTGTSTPRQELQSLRSHSSFQQPPEEEQGEVTEPSGARRGAALLCPQSLKCASHKLR
ncbi:hypothetical protein AV530_010245 [Patagioenas fasciata monilis]|uniref:Uncharacterized protein n=1 Tax=Patagioenas fasciata monilis TaxID=372326 RepID=A0A1V4KCW5_PATFA|nr:hypothetical protein AV530_010245 [Patagioenas fasciata monilis]